MESQDADQMTQRGERRSTMSRDATVPRPPLVVGAAGQLQVEFVRQGDCFEPRLFLEVANEHRILATADGGEPQDTCPRSPVLQQIDVIDLTETRRGVLGLGMWGQNHWSLSVEPTDDGGRVFDVACRAKQALPFFGSTYRRSGTHVPCGGLSFVSLEPATEISEQPDRWTIAARLDLAEIVLPTTVRWRYCVRLTA